MYCICGAAAIVFCKMKFGLGNTFDKSTIFSPQNKKDISSAFFVSKLSEMNILLISQVKCWQSNRVWAKSWL